MFWFIFFMAVIAAVYGISVVLSIVGWFVAFCLAGLALIVIIVVIGAVLNEG